MLFLGPRSQSPATSPRSPRGIRVLDTVGGATRIRLVAASGAVLLELTMPAGEYDASWQRWCERYLERKDPDFLKIAR